MTITQFAKTPPLYDIPGPMKGGNYKATGVKYNKLGTTLWNTYMQFKIEVCVTLMKAFKRKLGWNGSCFDS